MTEVEAAVRQLGKAIQADPRFTAYWRAKADNDADTDLQNDIQAFNLKKMSYQHETEKLEEKRCLCSTFITGSFPYFLSSSFPSLLIIKKPPRTCAT